MQQIDIKSYNLAPIVLFVYNRLDHTKQTIEALQKNEFANKSELFIYSDAAKNEESKQKVADVREYIKSINGEYDFIFSNPPYKKINSGKMPKNKTEQISKYEVLLTLEEIILEIRRLLKNYGEFFLVVPNSRLNDVFRYIYENRLNILSVKVNKYKKLDLVVVHGKKGGKINSEIEIK